MPWLLIMKVNFIFMYRFSYMFAYINSIFVQAGRSSRAKHGGAYFLAVYSSIQDPEPYENQEP